MQEDLLFWKKIYNDYQKRNPEFGKQSFNFSNEYFLIQDSITNDRLNFLKVFFADKPSLFERAYSEQHKADFIYNDLYYKLAYNNPAMEKFKVYQTFYNVSNPVTYEFSDVNFNDEKLLYNQSFSRFAPSFFINIALKRKKSDWKKAEIYNEVYNIIDNASLNGFCKSMLKAKFINEEINKLRVFRFSEGTTEQTYRKYVDLLKQNVNIKNQVALIEENLNKTISELNKITKGSQAPSCVITDSIGKSINIESLKGKIICFDVWASWCGPCINSFPEWNKLVDHFRNNPKMVFITISIDSSKEKWINALKKYNPLGLPYFSAGGFESDFSKKFDINAIPTNILIDEKGKIISISSRKITIEDLEKYK